MAGLPFNRDPRTGLVTFTQSRPKPKPAPKPAPKTTKATTSGGRKGSPSAASRKAPVKKAATKSAPQISLRALERNPAYGAVPSAPAPPHISLRALERDPRYGATPTATRSSPGSPGGRNIGGGGGGGPIGPAAPPPPNPLDVLQAQLGGQLDTLFKGLATTQTGIRDDYDARSAALLSALEGDYVTGAQTVGASQEKSQQMLDELAARIGMTGVTGTVDDLERRQAAERIKQLMTTNKSASEANFDLIRNNYRDFLGDKVSQANASGVMAQVGLIEQINALRAQQMAAAGAGGGGGGGGRGRRGGGGGGGGSSTTAAAEAVGPTLTAMPKPPGPPAGLKNLENPPNWQGGRVGSPSIAVKRYPGVSNPTRAGFPGTKPTAAQKAASAKAVAGRTKNAGVGGGAGGGGGGGSWKTTKPKVVVAGRKGSPSPKAQKQAKRMKDLRTGRR